MQCQVETAPICLCASIFHRPTRQRWRCVCHHDGLPRQSNASVYKHAQVEAHRRWPRSSDVQPSDPPYFRAGPRCLGRHSIPTLAAQKYANPEWRPNARLASVREKPASAISWSLRSSAVVAGDRFGRVAVWRSFLTMQFPDGGSSWWTPHRPV